MQCSKVCFKKTLYLAQMGNEDCKLKIATCRKFFPYHCEKSVEIVECYAKRGNADAQYNLGYIYHQGKIKEVKKCDGTAFAWFCKAAKQGHADAQYKVGLMYTNGWGIKRDYDAAAEWFCKSAKQGNAEAQFCLAIAYANGYGVENNDTTAFQWYSKAAEQGHTEAQEVLDTHYTDCP